MPVQACVDADKYSLADFLPKVTGYYTVQDVLRSMPYNPSNPILFYDKSKFAKAGLDPNRPPQTLDEVREYSKKIVASGAAKHGIALRIAEFFTEFWSSKNGQVYANNGNGRLRRATKADLDNPTERTVWTWWHDMVRDGLALNTGADVGRRHAPHRDRDRRRGHDHRGLRRARADRERARGWPVPRGPDRDRSAARRAGGWRGADRRRLAVPAEASRARRNGPPRGASSSTSSRPSS